MEADLLVAGSDHGRMAVWNLADRQLIHLLLGHRGVSPEVSELHHSLSSVVSLPVFVSYLKVLFETSK